MANAWVEAYTGGGGGGSSSSNPYVAIYANAAAAPKPKKKKKKAWWEKGLDAASGVIGGFINIGEDIVAEPVDWISGSLYDHEATTDDLAKTIAKDYKYRYAPLLAALGDTLTFNRIGNRDKMATDHLAEFWKRQKEDPFAAILDLVAVATLGASAAASASVKGASIASKGSKAGQVNRRGRFAGLEKSEELTELAQRKGTKNPNLLQKIADEEKLASASLGRKGVIDKALSGQAGRVKVLDDGTVLVPKKASLKHFTDTPIESIALASSPLRRSVQQVAARVSNAAPNTRIIGANARAGKLHNRVDRIVGENAVGAVVGTGVTLPVVGNSLRAAGKKVANDPKQEAALYARSTGATPDEIVASLQGKAQELGDIIKSPDGKARVHKEFKTSNAFLHEAKSKKWSPQYAARVAKERSQELQKKADDLQKDLESRTRMVELDELEDGASVQKRGGVRNTSAGPIDPKGKSVIARSEVMPNKTVSKERRLKELEAELVRDSMKVQELRADAQVWSRTHRAITRKGADGLEELQKRRAKYANLLTALDDPDRVLEAMKIREEIFHDKDVNKFFANPTRAMKRVEESQRKASAYTDDVIRNEMGVDARADRKYMMAEMVKGRPLTDEEKAFIDEVGIIRSHETTGSKKKNAKRASKRRRPTPPSGKNTPQTPGYTKYSRGYNMTYAQDSLSPGQVFKNFNEARAWKRKKQIMDRAAASGIRITSPQQKADLAAEGLYEFVGGNDKMLNAARSVQDKLDNELKMIVGENVMRDQASEMLSAMLAKYTDEAAEYAVPRVYYKHLAQEFERADNFLTRVVDAPTSLFRAAVLNLRPAWIVNNFVGQMMLLMYSQGVYHGAREYMREVNRGLGGKLALRPATREAREAEAEAMQRYASSLGGSGSARAEYAEAGRMAQKSYAGYLVDWPGLRRMRNQAGRPEGSMAAHSLALAAKSIPSGLKGLSDFMGKVNMVLTDDIPRRAAFMSEMRPIVAQMRKRNPDITLEEALDLTLSNEQTTARLIDKTLGDLIDFSRMNNAEREIIRRMVPFYGWIKGITLRTGRILRDKPMASNVSYQVGKEYVEGADERFGTEVPDFLQGALKVNGRIVPTGGLNIFQTPADVARMVLNPGRPGRLSFGQDSPMGTLNPVIKGLIEVGTGTDVFYGGNLYAKEGKQGPGDIFDPGFQDNPYVEGEDSRSQYNAYMSRYLTSLGPIGVYQRYKLAAEKDDSAKLLQRSNRDILFQYLGLNRATLNKEKAGELANDNRQSIRVTFDPETQLPILVDR